MCVARCLPARVRDLPDSAVRALAAPALRGPGRRAACDSRARRSRSGTPLGLGGGPGLESAPPAARRAAGHRGLTLVGGRPPPRVTPGPRPTLAVGSFFLFYCFFVKWPPRRFEKLRRRNGGTAECPDGMAQGARVAHALLRGRGAPTSKVRLSVDVELCRVGPFYSSWLYLGFLFPCDSTWKKKAHVVLNVALLCPKFFAPKVDWFSGIVDLFSKLLGPGCP